MDEVDLEGDKMGKYKGILSWIRLLLTRSVFDNVY
jgi:hypothetical protein